MAQDRLSDQIAEQLIAKIAAGEIAPGERLPGERQLAQQMGVSRVSIRSALQSLKTRGMLEAIQGGGTRVVSSAIALESPMATMALRSRDNLRDLAEIRLSLESWAARKAALNAAPEDVELLGRLVENMRTQRDSATNDIDFHMTIARASGSAIYVHVVEVIRDALAAAVALHRDELYVSDADNEVLFDHHRAIYEAVRDRDADAAEQAMGRHLRWVIQRYDDTLPN